MRGVCNLDLSSCQERRNPGDLVGLPSHPKLLQLSFGGELLYVERYCTDAKHDRSKQNMELRG